MKSFTVNPIPSVHGVFSLPGDKSIAHRAVILGSLSIGRTTVNNFPFNKDCLCTVNILKKLGAKLDVQENVSGAGTLYIKGGGLNGLRGPVKPLFIRESGTTFRLMAGVLAGQKFSVILNAGIALRMRPMRRVTYPLRLMGACIDARKQDNRTSAEEYPPLRIQGKSLIPVEYKIPVASAQVKSALLLAGLYTRGRTKIVEPVVTRDHTERMFRLFGADIKGRRGRPRGTIIEIKGGKRLLSPGRMDIPGDISSAAFFMVLTSLLSGSRLVLKNVSLNPSRLGIITILKRMGVQFHIRQTKDNRRAWEPSGDIEVTSGRLTGTVVRKEEIPLVIDELPVLMVAASFAKGRTVFKGVSELRVKETDRILSMTGNLRIMGARIKVHSGRTSEDIVIEGKRRLSGAAVGSFGDHRTAMSMIIAGLASRGRTTIDDVSCIDKSFPGFLRIIRNLVQQR